MATEQFIDFNLGLVFNPLVMTHGLEVLGNVASEQTYDLSTGQYAPDYGVSFLVIKPWMNIVDPDGVLTDGPVTIANPAWVLLEDGEETQISNGTDFAINSDGTLSVKRNCQPNKTMSIRFKGQYLDERTGSVLTMVDEMPILCHNVAQEPKLTLDFPRLSLYDPITAGTGDITVHAYLKIGVDAVDTSNYELVWEKKDADDTSYVAIDPSDPMDYDVIVASDKKSAVVKRNLIGKRIDIRVRAKYDPYGNPSSVTLTDKSPKAEVTFMRKLPVPSVTVLRTSRYPAGQASFTPEAKVYVGRKEITDPEKWWDLVWYMSQNNANGTVTRTQIATGTKPTIPTTKIVKAYGATGTVGAKEKDPLMALKDSDGKILVDSDGSTIVG